MNENPDDTKTTRPSSDEHDFNCTMSIGERAIGYLRQFRTPAIPRNYEIFYIHSSGYNKELSEALRTAIEKHSRLTDKDAEQIFQTYIQPAQYSEQVGSVSAQVASHIQDILGSIASASQKAGSFGDALKGISVQLGDIKTPDQLKIVIKKLVLSTNEMAGHNNGLETKLAEARKQIEELHQSLETIRAESLTDQLTGLSNRKRFDQVLEMEMIEADGSQEPLCVMLLDIDNFKAFNDTFGHQTGDQVLRLVAHRIKTNVKGRDHAARYGGEEFSILLPKTTLKAGITVAENICNNIRAKELIKKSTGESLGQITMSIGVVRYKSGETPAEFIHRADACLYAAKKAGRNNVKCETDSGVNFETEAA